MGKTIKIVILIIILLIFQNCIDLGIYVSKMPLGSQGAFSADPALAGIWHRSSKNKDDNSMETVEIILFNENEYILRSGEGRENSLLRAYITIISGTSFLNIQELSENGREFVFCKYNLINGEELHLHFVSDKLFEPEKPLTEKELRKFIKKNLSDPALFNDEMKFSFLRIPR